MANWSKVYVSLGQRISMEIAYSEAAVHLRVAGTVLDVELTDAQYPMAQLFKDGKEYSFPITPGEAGFYKDHLGYYYVIVTK